MPHNFDDKQKIDSHGSVAHATGEVDAGEKMFWIAAFLYQNGPGHYAAAAGEREWLNGVDKKWTCPTNMAPGSRPFKKGLAHAWALARVRDGGEQFFAWRDDVELE
jgi:hypothetical protein